MRREIEAATGAPCLFIQGATADLNPILEWGPNDYQVAEILGKRVAQGVLDRLKN